jgi:CRP/FNR family cyclic AMP-dependent transcriptional regulator
VRIPKETFARYVRAYAESEFVFREGEKGEAMYLIVEGEVEIRKDTSGSSAKTLVKLKKGDLFGEMALIDHKLRSASAITAGPAKLLALNAQLFDAMIEQNPDFSRKMIRVLAERLRSTNQIIQTVLSNNRENQLMRGIADFAGEHGTSTFKGQRLNVEEFVDWAVERLGMSKPDIRKALQTLQERGVLNSSALGDGEVILSGTVSR